MLDTDYPLLVRDNRKHHDIIIIHCPEKTSIATSIGCIIPVTRRIYYNYNRYFDVIESYSKQKKKKRNVLLYNIIDNILCYLAHIILLCMNIMYI